MDEKKIEFLLKYFDLLLTAQKEGCKVYQEITATTQELAKELALHQQEKLDNTIIIRENGDVKLNGKIVITCDGIVSDRLRGTKILDKISDELKRNGIKI